MEILPLNQVTPNSLALQEIIRTILDGGDMETARQDFRSKLTGMNHGELIAAIQQLEEELGGGAIFIAEKHLKDFILRELIDAGVMKLVDSYPPGHPIQNYVDENRWIFPRSPGIIGREVRYCHPPKSVDMVLQIIEAFRMGKKDVAEFWIQIQEQFIHIRFFALRDKDKNYRGVLEIMQEVSQIRKLEGNQRLLDWE